MKSHYLLSAVALATLSAPAFAQTAEPLTIVPIAAAEALTMLPANTEVALTMNQTLTTKGNELHEGDTFSMTVAQDVFLADQVVIPKGTRGGGRVTWMTSKGAFGKSGKMEIEIEYLELGGRRIPLEGHYRQEGEGNTVATIGGVIAAGVFAAFITGKSGVIPQGRELTARTKEDLPVRFAAARPAAPAAAAVVVETAVPAEPAKATPAAAATH